MKTPRELLLQRHEAMDSKLDALRRNTVAALPAGQSWRDFIISLRWHLAGMGAVWLAVLVLNADRGSEASLAAIPASSSPARVLVAELLEKRREVLELTDMPVPAALPMAFPRRSQNNPVFVLV